MLKHLHYVSKEKGWKVGNDSFQPFDNSTFLNEIGGIA